MAKPNWVIVVVFCGLVMLVHQLWIETHHMADKASKMYLPVSVERSEQIACPEQRCPQCPSAAAAPPPPLPPPPPPPPPPPAAPSSSGGAVPKEAASEGELDLTEAFVTFSNQARFDLVEVLLMSVHEFSTRPIVVFGLGDEVPFDTKRFPRMVKRKINPAPRSVFFNKLKAITLSGVRYGVLVESDDIVNWKVDDLFAAVRRYAHHVPAGTDGSFGEASFPLLPRHPQHRLLDNRGRGSAPLPFGHAHVLFSYKTIPFILDVYEGTISNSQHSEDESAINSQLWKQSANHQACIYDPYKDYSKWYYDQNWPENPVGEMAHMGWSMDGTKHNAFPGSQIAVAFHLIHGCKVAQEAKDILTKLIANKGKPVYFNGKKWAHTYDEVKVPDATGVNVWC